MVSFGLITGGTAPNVIPDEARAKGTIRTFNDADRYRLHRAIEATAKAAADARGAAAEVRFRTGGLALVNDPGLVHRLDPLLGLGITVAETPFRSCGSDDFAEYGLEAASVMCFVGTGRINGAGLHNGSYLPDREALRTAARAYAAGYVAASGIILTASEPGGGSP